MLQLLSRKHWLRRFVENTMDLTALEGQEPILSVM